MICNEFKGGIGTSSRVLACESGRLHASACSCSATMDGATNCASPAFPSAGKSPSTRSATDDVGSIIIVVATDAPLIPTQLKRLARRVSLGLGRDGSYSGDGSGDIFVAFSTANPGAAGLKGIRDLKMLPNDSLDPLFLATVQATEEAVDQRHGRRRNHDRHRRPHCHSPPARPSARGPEEVQPPGKMTKPGKVQYNRFVSGHAFRHAETPVSMRAPSGAEDWGLELHYGSWRYFRCPTIA